MKTLRYCVELQEDKDGIIVTFPDMPYGVTSGEDLASALLNAVDCLEEIIASMMKDKKDIPLPGPAKGRRMVTLSPGFSAKLLLYIALREQHISKSELARRLNWQYPQVVRLFDTQHSSHLSQLVAVASALKKRIVIGLEDIK